MICLHRLVLVMLLAFLLQSCSQEERADAGVATDQTPTTGNKSQSPPKMSESEIPRVPEIESTDVIDKPKKSTDLNEGGAKSRREEVLGAHDSNGDGVLQKEEWLAYVAARKSDEPEAGRPKLTKKEKERLAYRDVGQPVLRGARLALIEKFDKNNDGELNASETAAARAYLAEQKLRKGQAQ